MDDYTYEAFVSYRHRELDTAVAKAVHKQLETYRIPAYIRERTGKQRMGKVFRDQDELPLMADLGEGIRRALEQSAWLIVICSPELPQSKWCMAEVDYFIELGRRDRILTVLISGEPADSFPKQLRFVEENGELTEREPLAADIRAATQRGTLKLLRREKLRLLAPMLDVGYDDLRRRQRERTLRMAVTGSVAAAVFFAVFGGFALRQSATISRQNEEITTALNQVYTSQSKIYANYASEQLGYGNIAAAVLLALEGLPADLEHPDRPIIPEAVGALLQAVYHQSSGDYVPFVQVASSYDVVLAPDGKTFVTFDSAGARIYETATMRLIAEKQGGRSVIYAFHNEEQDLEGAQVRYPLYNKAGDRVFLPNGLPTIVDVRTGETVKSGYFEDAGELAEYGLSRYLMEYPIGFRRVRDLGTGEALFEIPADNVTSKYLFSPNDKYAMYAEYQKMDVYDMDTRELLYSIPSEGKMVEQGYTFFSPNSQFLVLTRRSSDHEEMEDGSQSYVTTYYYQVFETLTGTLAYESTFTLQRTNPPNYSNVFESDLCHFLFSPDSSKLVVPMPGGEYGVLDLKRDRIAGKLDNTSTQYISFSPNSDKIISADVSGTVSYVRILDAEDASLLSTFSGTSVNFTFSRAYITPDEESIITAGINNRTRESSCLVLYRKPDQETAEVSETEERVYLSGDNKHAVVKPGDGEALALRHLPSGRTVLELEGSEDYTTFSANAGIVAALGKDRLAVWDLETGEQRFEVDMLTAREYGVWIAEDGQTVSTLYQQYGVVAGGFCTFDANTGKQLCETGVGGTGDSIMVFDPTGKWFAFLYDNRVQVYNARTGRRRFILDDYPQGLQILGMYQGFQTAFSQDGTLLVVACEKKQTVEIIDPNSGERLREIDLGERSADAFALSPDGSQLAVAATGGYLEAYRVDTGEQLFSFYEPEGLKEIAYSTDGNYLIATGIHDPVTGEKLSFYIPPPLPAWTVDEEEDRWIIPLEGAQVLRMPTLEEAVADAQELLRSYQFVTGDKLKYTIE